MASEDGQVLTQEALVAALLELLSRPKPVKNPGPLNEIDLDWEQLKLLVRVRQFQDGVNLRDLAGMVGLTETTLGRFLRDPGRLLEVRSTIRLMAWLGYSDFAEFLKEA